MKPIIVKSPTRVDLAGGTLDMWPLYLLVGEAVTVNVAIDIFTTAEIHPLEDSQIVLDSKDLNLTKKYANLQECLSDTDPRMTLLQAQIRYWKPQRGFILKTQSDSPVGGGLGGSSSLTISCMKAFQQFTSADKKDVYQMVRVASNIEAQILNTPTGTQDYFPAITGGLSILQYGIDGVQQETQSIDQSTFAENFLLVYTGKAHHSGLNNFEVLQNAVNKNAKTIQALNDIKVIANDMAQVCRKKDWNQLTHLFQREYEARIRLAPSFSSPEIEQLAEVSLKNGASAVKICGAGGGGCVLIWCKDQQRGRVAESCQNAGFQVLSARPVDLLGSH